MNFLSSDALEEHLLELLDLGDLVLSTRDPISIDWDRWEDPGAYPNNLGLGPLPPGPWEAERVNGSIGITFAVPCAWVAANGEICFKFDDEAPCPIAEWLAGREELGRELTNEAQAHAVEESGDRGGLDGFRLVFGEVTAERAGHCTRVTVEARLEPEE